MAWKPTTWDAEAPEATTFDVEIVGTASEEWASLSKTRIAGGRKVLAHIRQALGLTDNQKLSLIQGGGRRGECAFEGPDSYGRTARVDSVDGDLPDFLELGRQ